MMFKTELKHLSPIEQQALQNFVQLLQEQFDDLIRLVILFGSKARGDSSPDSDLDLLVVVDSDDWRQHKQIRYLAVDICLKYDYTLDISPRIWSVSHLREIEALQTSLYRNIQRDGINLFKHALSPSFSPSSLRSAAIP